MATGRWAEIRERTFDTPEEKARYEVTKRAIIQTRQLLMEIEVARERAGLSKAELARRMSADPSAIRRLFSSPNSNPTLRTVLDMLSALDLSIEIRPSNPIALPASTTETAGRSLGTRRTTPGKQRARRQEVA